MHCAVMQLQCVVICFVMFVADAIAGLMVEAYSSIGLVTGVVCSEKCLLMYVPFDRREDFG